jgi:uncharacterized glyoxalase superfamily protein PhnB
MSWAKNVYAVTLVVDDLGVAREFYARVFDLPEYFADDNSVVFKVGELLVNLLVRDEAYDLVAPAEVGSAADGVRVQFTIPVEDVDAVAAQLQSRGVVLLRGPEDRPWGIRTATFQDPFGHTWELAK